MQGNITLTQSPSEASLITELIYTNLKRIACYTSALAFEVNDMAKRLYNCMIGESMNNIEELYVLAGHRGISVDTESNLPIIPSFSITQLEADTCNLYESATAVPYIGAMARHTILNQYKELKVSFSIIKQHYSRFPLTVAAPAESRSLATAS